jgi:predicted O-methyltransferase YrrM
MYALTFRVATAVVSLCLSAPALAQDGDPPREQILAHLKTMRASQRGMMNVAPAEGEYLSNMIRKLNGKRVLEIGTSNGYSGIWMAMALRETGGKLITLEIDKGRHSLALKNFKAVGLDNVVDARLTDALKELEKLQGPFDLVFIDAWKPDYMKYLQMTLPMVRSGGAITAHNVHSHPGPMQDFLQEIKTNPSLKTEFVSVGRAGISVSYKK